MKVTQSEKLSFFKVAVQKNLGPLLVGFLFIIAGLVLIYIGVFIAENNFLTWFGISFITFSGSFLIYTMPSSFTHHYEQELTKTYGSYTTAKVTHKRIDDFSHTSTTYENGKAKHHEEYLYVVEFEFNYNHQSYFNECYFEEKSTYEAISVGSELPIQFLKNNPNKITLRRRKLSAELGIPEKMCQ